MEESELKSRDDIPLLPGVKSSFVLVWMESTSHRAGTVFYFFFSRRNWDSPTPSSRTRVCPHPFVPGGGGGTFPCGRGGGGVPILTRGHTCTLWYSIYCMYMNFAMFLTYHKLQFISRTAVQKKKKLIQHRGCHFSETLYFSDYM
jgi:hypothetical protein